MWVSVRMLMQNYREISQAVFDLELINMCEKGNYLASCPCEGAFWGTPQKTHFSCIMWVSIGMLVQNFRKIFQAVLELEPNNAKKYAPPHIFWPKSMKKIESKPNFFFL